MKKEYVIAKFVETGSVNINIDIEDERTRVFLDSGDNNDEELRFKINDFSRDCKEMNLYEFSIRQYIVNETELSYLIDKSKSFNSLEDAESFIIDNSIVGCFEIIPIYINEVKNG